ncbi:hypothetical protein ACQP2U_02740 [Nocardia sp. CA-084685]|uniref:hypothetical protein n=1 Tax=Nocardia sp. CA-084685 TaxID=3239970 RepID=UPI003D9766CC
MAKFIARAILSILASALFVGLGTTQAVATPVDRTPTAVSEVVEEITMPPGDTVELRTGAGAVVGAVLGGLAGLPFFVVGAVPGALIGAALGALIGNVSWQIANAYLGG